jgi:hypothetical protein
MSLQRMTEIREPEGIAEVKDEEEADEEKLMKEFVSPSINSVHIQHIAE